MAIAASPINHKAIVSNPDNNEIIPPIMESLNK